VTVNAPEVGHAPAGEDVEATVESILDRLRTDGGRITAGRRAIVSALLTADDHHVTAEELAATVQARHPHVHLSTVYRTLEALEALGVLDRISLGSGGSIFHLASHAHHHLVCVRCGAVVELPTELVAPLGGELEARFGYSLKRSRMVISGRCAECQAEAPAT
jgi:Fur family transcriptional regulator, ferric uptake regulator